VTAAVTMPQIAVLWGHRPRSAGPDELLGWRPGQPADKAQILALVNRTRRRQGRPEFRPKG
jgi:hypothetical protein